MGNPGEVETRECNIIEAEDTQAIEDRHFCEGNIDSCEIFDSSQSAVIERRQQRQIFEMEGEKRGKIELEGVEFGVVGDISFLEVGQIAEVQCIEQWYGIVCEDVDGKALKGERRDSIPDLLVEGGKVWHIIDQQCLDFRDGKRDGLKLWQLN